MRFGCSWSWRLGGFGTNSGSGRSGLGCEISESLRNPRLHQLFVDALDFLRLSRFCDTKGRSTVHVAGPQDLTLDVFQLSGKFFAGCAKADARIRIGQRKLDKISDTNDQLVSAFKQFLHDWLVEGYPRRDSNPYAQRHKILSLARLPISPPGFRVLIAAARSPVTIHTVVHDRYRF